MLDAFRAFDSEAFKYTRGNLERLCSAFRDREGDRDCPRNLELKSFLLSYCYISDKVSASGLFVFFYLLSCCLKDSGGLFHYC